MQTSGNIGISRLSFNKKPLLRPFFPAQVVQPLRTPRTGLMPRRYEEGVEKVGDLSALQEKERENTLTPEEMDQLYRARLAADEARRARVMGEQHYAKGTDTVPAMLTPGEAVLNVGAAEELGRGKIRALNARGNAKGSLYSKPKRAKLMPPVPGPVQGFQGGASAVNYGEWTPQQQAIIDRINSGQTDYTFGPGSPNPTQEDLGTYVGGRYSPSGGFTQEGGVALAPSEYNQFSPEDRRALGIMDVAPQDQAGQIERYYGGGSSGLRLVNQLGYDPSKPQGGSWGSGTGGPTRNIAGLIGGIAGNALFPGAGFLTGPLAKLLTAQIQRGGISKLGASLSGLLPRRTGTGAVDDTDTGGGYGPGNFSPEYLRSIGYEPGQGTGSLFPGVPTGGFGGGGIGGQGGSFFGDLRGVRGGPLAGSTFNLGASGGNLGDVGGMIANQHLSQALRFGPDVADWTGGGSGHAGNPFQYGKGAIAMTPQLYGQTIDYYRTMGLPNPGWMGQPIGGGNLSGAGRPMTLSR